MGRYFFGKIFLPVPFEGGYLFMVEWMVSAYFKGDG
jgi:hypothetical protein